MLQMVKWEKGILLLNLVKKIYTYPLPSCSKFGTKSGGLKGIRSLPDGDLAGGGIGLLPACEIPPSVLLPLRVGLSAKGFAYSGGRGGVNKERMGGTYDGSS